MIIVHKQWQIHINCNYLPWVVSLPVATIGVCTTLIVGLAPNVGSSRRRDEEVVGHHRGSDGAAGHEEEDEDGKVNLIALTDRIKMIHFCNYIFCQGLP